MPDQFYIQSYVSLSNGQAQVNGQSLSLPDHNDLLKALYQHLSLDYPKFFKMDELCKLAFMAAELLLKEESLQNYTENQIAIVLANASSTLETDRKHQQSIQNEEAYFPSPAVFVYTLPNITIGEIAIRHKLKGENTFFIAEQYDIRFMSYYTNSILNHERAEKVISGWVEWNTNGYEAFLYLAGKEKTGLSLAHTQALVDQLYTNSKIK
ncbi:MAG TPA: hypothetical protein VNB90_01750 [Cytophagaceae bacterium]|nr:hypothetical protein [Cytophagaceae bacterium]